MPLTAISLRRRWRRLAPAMGAVLFIVATSGCSPSLAPLYRDFDAAGAEPEPTTANETIDARIRRAVAQAGWEVVESAAPNVIATKARIVRRFGLYYTEVSIEVSPVNQTYVRVLVHPYRVYFTGHRSKMPFMKRSIRNAVFPDLGAAFEAEGIRDVGYAQKRDGVSDG